MKSRASGAILLAVAVSASACVQTGSRANTTEQPPVAEKPLVFEKSFVAGGSVDMQLDGGSYTVRPTSENFVRVSLSGNAGNARVEIATNGTHANVTVNDTPHNNFQATLEVPKATDLVIRLSGGNLVMAAITGNKDVESNGGNTEIAVGDPNDYSSVDASVKAGDIHASVFDGSKSGLFQHFTWSGPGKYTLKAKLGAGNLALRK